MRILGKAFLIVVRQRRSVPLEVRPREMTGGSTEPQDEQRQKREQKGKNYQAPPGTAERNQQVRSSDSVAMDRAGQQHAGEPEGSPAARAYSSIVQNTLPGDMVDVEGGSHQQIEDASGMRGTEPRGGDEDDGFENMLIRQSEFPAGT